MAVPRSFSFNGEPGTGKTYAIAKTVTDLGLKAVVIDFEDKFEMTVDGCFAEFKDQFEIHSILVPATESKTDPTLREGKKVVQADMKITFKHAPDYLKTCLTLIPLMNEILDRSDFNILVFDGASPTLRNYIGLAYWKHLHPGRTSPEPVEWGAMNDFEQSFIDAGIGWAKANKGLFITTGQMKEDYRDNKKVGLSPYISGKCQHSIDVTLELEKKIYRDHTDYTCTCLGSSVLGSWFEPMTLERGISDILLEKGLIEY